MKIILIRLSKILHQITWICSKEFFVSDIINLKISLYFIILLISKYIAQQNIGRRLAFCPTVDTGKKLENWKCVYDMKMQIAFPKIANDYHGTCVYLVSYTSRKETSMNHSLPWFLGKTLLFLYFEAKDTFVEWQIYEVQTPFFSSKINGAHGGYLM